MSNYTQDYLLDKKIKIFQPTNGYRASSDAVIVSSLINNVKKGEKILDIGSGTGAISLCLASRFPENLITGFEIQSELAELSNKSASENGFANLNYINHDIKHPLKEPAPCTFHHVITNPPYSEKDMASPNTSKALAHNHQNFSLSEWLFFAIKMLRPQGYLYTINRAEAVDEILHCLHGKMGNIKIIPLFSKFSDKKAKRVLLIARKDSHAPSEILPAFIVHNEKLEYSEKAEKILRLGHSYFQEYT